MPLWGEGTFPLENVKIGGWSAQCSRARWLWGLGLGDIGESYALMPWYLVGDLGLQTSQPLQPQLYPL